MNLPISTSSTGGLLIAAILGTVFGVLLNKGRVTDYNVIVNLFRFKDLTVLKIMLTAIVVGGLGVYGMMSAGWIATYHIKDTNMLGVVLGSAIFGVGMALYGYCPGTAIGAVATGRIHAMVGFAGMLFGGVAYALSFQWVKEHILSVGQMGKVRLPDVSGISTEMWWVILPVVSLLVFSMVERKKGFSL